MKLFTFILLLTLTAGSMVAAQNRSSKTELIGVIEKANDY